jgi:hypothetical protein
MIAYFIFILYNLAAYQLISGTPKLIGTFGDEGGIYSGTLGEVGELKLNGVTGVGTDAAGNIYVSNNGFGSSGTDLRKFWRFRKLQWQLLGLQFVDNADADPGTGGLDVLTKHEHFILTTARETVRNRFIRHIPWISSATQTIRDYTTKTIWRRRFLSVGLRENVSCISRGCMPNSSASTV